MSLPTHSRPGSVLDLNLDKISHKSSRWGDDDDLPDWDPHVPNDSGLHSLAVGSSILNEFFYPIGKKLLLMYLISLSVIFIL